MPVAGLASGSFPIGEVRDVPAVSGSGFTCYGADGAARVYFLDASNHVNVLAYVGGDRPWQNTDLTAKTVAPPRPRAAR